MTVFLFDSLLVEDKALPVWSWPLLALAGKTQPTRVWPMLAPPGWAWPGLAWPVRARSELERVAKFCV